MTRVRVKLTTFIIKINGYWIPAAEGEKAEMSESARGARWPRKTLLMSQFDIARETLR